MERRDDFRKKKKKKKTDERVLLAGGEGGKRKKFPCSGRKAKVRLYEKCLNFFFGEGEENRANYLTQERVEREHHLDGPKRSRERSYRYTNKKGGKGGGREKLKMSVCNLQKQEKKEEKAKKQQPLLLIPPALLWQEGEMVRIFAEKKKKKSHPPLSERESGKKKEKACLCSIRAGGTKGKAI